MRIGELAARTGVSVRALRYYEEQGLLAAERSPSGQRRYPGSAADRVGLIQRLYAAGLSSKTIVELMPCVVDGRATPELLARLAAHRDRIDERIADLTDTRNRLDSVITGATTNMLTGRSCRADNASQQEPASA
ncbi:MerR family transcriptional regulator [Actinomadura fibrosa]|uniref:MerR family transcriptional regulator n=1 Tax=Actinomadura fibrosa TaxID=111802 RepID=A0ABW2XVM7_9ACTN|nr:MerR family transcriptional regulator [Actinomadura fibrosa]